MMDKPWNEKVNSTREADTLTNFVLFCEDEVSEPLYFKNFENMQLGVKITTHAKQGSMHKNVVNAINSCKSSGLISFDGDDFQLEEGTHIWCVFDRDKEETDEKIARGNIEFDECIKTAERNGIKVAWSNDCFELWILQHFEDVSLDQKDRSNYYDRLTEIFMSMDDPIGELERIRGDNFTYKSHLKNKKRFITIVKPAIMVKYEDAIRRAITAEEHFQEGNHLNSQKAPMTTVHHLLVDILEASGSPFERAI